MKKSLQLMTGIVILFISVLTSNGQTSILAENFSGFSTGSHTTPSTSDASSSLDSKTIKPGWTGALIYPAGGEVKIGTSGTAGWIETPSIDLSGNSGKFNLEFDIARWTGDATTVQVLLNGTALGSIITPTDNFQRIQISATSGTSTSKIKIQALTKRFYLDNLTVTSENVSTDVYSLSYSEQPAKLFPVPARNELTICNIQNTYLIEIHDITGRLINRTRNEGEKDLIIDVSGYKRGLYLVSLRSNNGIQLLKFLKI